ncbi:hypothetical protein ADIS_0028 [Lunatimonas lonarensis]|uniref:Cytochrome c domain-containing protein n=1 Tax=Lunatimonas lonarensis TaxID=1232681 RepID=R7ZZD7_9BACT|nr:hypothetical protein [Lunatimonas lonarensis]EON79461.1 hypothetical protein ADIS_0028 [Lunatimonas lonarensis]
MKYLLLSVSFAFLIACNHKTDTYSELGNNGWLKGSDEEKMEEIAHQLGGFSRTMVEVSYRYSELYWAGEDQNWKYAEHQLEHLVEALEDGLTRRPVRATSSKDFLEKTVPSVEEAIASEDKAVFDEGFRTLTLGCNVCHAKEGEGFIRIQKPLVRSSPVRF